MEDIKNYIESGILELYVLGDLPLKERKDVEDMCLKYPEVKAELYKIEINLERMADGLQISPSDNAKKSFFDAIQILDSNESEALVLEDTNNLVQEDSEGKLEYLEPKRNYTFYKYAFAASFALLVLSLAAMVSLYNNLNQSKQQIAQLQNSNQSFANRANYLEKEVTGSKTRMALYTNPEIKKVALAGTANAPEAKMMVMWDAKEQKVMIDMDALELPKNDATHQYQLWALVNGKPVDLGVFDAEGNLSGIKEMKDIGAAQTFAVTLEPKGGSVSPTLSQMIVAGNI